MKNCLSPVPVYHYKVEISSDGKEWTVVGPRLLLEYGPWAGPYAFRPPPALGV